MISSDFLNTAYIRTHELEVAMQRHQANEARVIPIMLRPCDFTGEVFSKLAGLPTKMKAVTTWVNQDEAWTDVVRGLRREFEAYRDEARKTAPVSAQTFASSQTEEATTPNRRPRCRWIV